jgi:8-oxo-dGTP pyrophosphatase MutT (NUDIX family)
MRVRLEVQGVIFDDAEGEKKVLLLKKMDFSAKSYRWRLLKGGVNSGETDVEALQREIFEESGLKNIKVLEKIHGYWFVFKGVKHVVSCYLVKANSKTPLKLQKSEVSDYLWTTKEQAISMLHWNHEKDAVRILE